MGYKASVEVSFPEFVDGDVIRVSASTYMTFQRCPESANARLQGIFGPDSRAGFIGTLAHRVFSRHLTAGPITSEEFVQACREEIGGSNLNQKMVSLELKPSQLAAAIEEVRGLYERFTKLPTEGFEGSEVSLHAEPGGGVELVGSVDAVYREDLGGHRLVDWKTGELGESEDQLLFYSLLWAIDRDELPAYVEAVSVRTGERFRTVPSGDDVRGVAEGVGDLVNKIRSSWHDGAELERRGGPWCKFCPLLADCREGQSADALLG